MKRRAREALELRSYIARDGVTYTGRAIPLHVLIDIATDTAEKSRDRVAAANALLDRSEGKPTQSLDLSGDVQIGNAVTKLPPLTEEQLALMALVDDGLGDDPGDHG